MSDGSNLGARASRPPDLPSGQDARAPRMYLLLLMATGFALAYTQSPLFFSNQNQYLLHGLADAGYGHLSHDWLASTHDPTPAFSVLVAGLYKLGGLFAIQIAFFLLLMLYFISMWKLVEGLNLGGTGIPACAVSPTQAGMPVPPMTQRLLVFTAMFIAAHAAIFRLGSVFLTGTDYPWYLQAGVAGQYLLGPGLQPSSFGVLLVTSLAAFARGRPLLAAALAALSADAHATYLLPAALLTIGYATALVREKRTRDALTLCLVSLLIVAPSVAYIASHFWGFTQNSAAAQSILAKVRIPHHSQIGRWLNWVAVIQILWIGLGLFLLRRTRLFVPLLVATLGSILLTSIQAVINNDTLALLFPWRISALLVPVSTAIVATRLAAFDRNARSVDGLAAFLVVLQAAGGVAVMAFGLGYQMNEAELPLLKFVREKAGPGDVFLIPTRIPPVGTGSRGVISTSFTPPPRPKPGSNLIPVDLQRFRLATGAAIYVDFKSVPYATSEVLEWHRRVKRVESWYAEQKWDVAETRERMLKEGITHIVVPRLSKQEPPILVDGFEQVYEDGAYAVYRLR